MAWVTFEVTCETQWGDRVVVVGSHEQLGTWSPSSSKLELKTEDSSYPRWRGSVLLQPGEHVHFKFVILGKSTGARWEESIRNRELIVPGSSFMLELQADFDNSGSALLFEPVSGQCDAECAEAAPSREDWTYLFEEKTWPLMEVLQQAADEYEAEGCPTPLSTQKSSKQADSDDETRCSSHDGPLMRLQSQDLSVTDDSLDFEAGDSAPGKGSQISEDDSLALSSDGDIDFVPAGAKIWISEAYSDASTCTTGFHSEELQALA